MSGRALPASFAATSAMLLLAGCAGQLATDPVATESPLIEEFECDSSPASSGDFEVHGSVLSHDSEPVAEAMVTVVQDGVEVTACTTEEGRWGVRLPADTVFLVAIDPRSVPEGVELSGGRNLASAFEMGALNERVINLFLRPTEY